jgi:hypothetical protein
MVASQERLLQTIQASAITSPTPWRINPNSRPSVSFGRMRTAALVPLFRIALLIILIVFTR